MVNISKETNDSEVCNLHFRYDEIEYAIASIKEIGRYLSDFDDTKEWYAGFNEYVQSQYHHNPGFTMFELTIDYEK